MQFTVLCSPTPLRGANGRDVALVDPISDTAPPLRVTAEDLTRAQERDLLRDPHIALAPVMPTQVIVPRASAASASNWALKSLGSGDSSLDGSGVRVAILDTGIDAAHPAFEGIVKLETADFTGEGGGDANGHGTHCAGTFFGRDCGGRRIGVAPGVGEVYVGKVLGKRGGGTTDMLARALTWAADNGAQVISLSLGYDFPGMVKGLEEEEWPIEMATSRALEAYRANLRLFDTLVALLRARSAFGGVVLIAAAGNESQRDHRPDFRIAASLPAAAEGVISVGALQSTKDGLRVAPFSNTGPTLCAPGVGILSARAGGGLTTLSGTSMATPHVAGVAARWWQGLSRAKMQPRLIAPTVAAKLLGTASTDGFAADEDPSDYGAGQVTLP